MRTFPKSLARFREIVNERGQELRKLNLEQLKQIGTTPAERLTVESRPATIGVIVQPLATGV